MTGIRPQRPTYLFTQSQANLYGYEDVKYHQFSVEEDGSPITSNSKTIFVGSTILTNNTDRDQTLSTNSFEKTMSNSVTNTTTHGFNFGVTASAEFKIPFIGSTGLEMSTEYNFSKENSNTKTEEYKYIATPQNIVVPAHSQVEVTVNLETVKTRGKVNLLTKVSGLDYGNFVYKDPNGKYQSYGYDLTFNEIVSGASNYEQPKDTLANPDGETVTIKGKGTYEAEYGTRFAVSVKPVNQMSRSIDEGYTYKANPEIVKER